MRDDFGSREGEGSCQSHLSVIVPAYNEEEVLPEFHRRLSNVMNSLPITWEVIYVNDGSGDSTLALLEGLAKEDPHVGVVDLSRNFGKEIAMTAGLDHASADAVIVIDADLQDPPELIRDFVREWQESGVDVVYGKRRTRVGESAVKRVTAHLFYRVMQKVSRVQIPEDTGDFRLMSHRAVSALRRLRERHRFMKGLFAWIGFPQKAILCDREPRFAGTTKFDYWKLWNFALEGITSFTTAPLKIATYLGLLVAALAFAFGAFFIYKTLVYGDPVQGFPTLIVVVLFLGGAQLAFIGVLGEYLGRMFDESKSRPLYLIKQHAPPKSHLVNQPKLSSSLVQSAGAIRSHESNRQ
jgi:glycosyltransferase involved in cell wall biosynthesis